MYFLLKYIVTLFYKKLRIKIVVSFLSESGPRMIYKIYTNTKTRTKYMQITNQNQIYTNYKPEPNIYKYF